MSSTWFWAIFFIWTLVPVWRQYWLNSQRMRAIRQMERRRNTRVITLIHRQETISFLGIPLRNYISIEDSEQILRAIRLTPDSMPIDLILHTPGGLVLASEQIAHALNHHPSKVTVFVPHYAMSGGTMIALSADRSSSMKMLCWVQSIRNLVSTRLHLCSKWWRRNLSNK